MNLWSMSFESKPVSRDGTTENIRRDIGVVLWNGARMMAYQDEQGIWRDYFRHSELSGHVEVIQPL